MSHKFKRDTKKALEWIVGVLRKHQVSFQISGGCAAKIYGSPRELNDIDIRIPEDCFEKIMADVKPFIIYGPEHYIDQKWDLYLVTLEHAGQEIDIGGGNAKISTKNRDTWIDFPTDFSKAVMRTFLGLEVPVIPKKDLVAYKKLLDGDHQIIDIQSVK
ncbi:MAG: MazG-related protein [Candidatus Taylorbacteria bacterium]|nr:MazG-related protein [Candidatus Taylorbacteria bacterium]